MLFFRISRRQFSVGSRWKLLNLTLESWMVVAVRFGEKHSNQLLAKYKKFWESEVNAQHDRQYVYVYVSVSFASGYSLFLWDFLNSWNLEYFYTKSKFQLQTFKCGFKGKEIAPDVEKYPIHDIRNPFPQPLWLMSTAVPSLVVSPWNCYLVLPVRTS